LALSHYAAGVAAYRDDQAAEARQHLEKATEFYEKLDARLQGAEAYLRLGRLELRLNNTDDARKALERAHQWALHSDEKLTEVKQLRVQIPIQLVQLEMQQDRWKAARDMATRLVRRAEAYGDSNSLGWGYNALARAELKLGRRDQAIEALEEGIVAAKKAGDGELMKRLLENLNKFEN